MQGVCADCWAPKDGRAPLHAPPRPRGTPFFDVDWDDPFTVVPAVAVVLSICAAVLWKVLA